MYLDRVLMAANRRARQYTSKISASSLAAHGEPLFLCPTAVSNLQILHGLCPFSGRAENGTLICTKIPGKIW